MDKLVDAMEAPRDVILSEEEYSAMLKNVAHEKLQLRLKYKQSTLAEPTNHTGEIEIKRYLAKTQKARKRERARHLLDCASLDAKRSGDAYPTPLERRILNN